VLTIVAGTSLAGTAPNALAGTNPLGTILSGGSATPGLGGVNGLLNLFGLGGGGFSAALTGGFTSGLDTLGIALSAGADAIGGFSAALGAAGAVLGPLGLAAGLAIPLLSKLFSGSSSPSKVEGQFGVSAGTSGFEDNVSTPSAFGNLGFVDANTQQFSGEAAQAFNQIVSGALDAFAGRMSQDQQQRLAGILQNTTFATESGTFTTQDFLQQYGGAVLQQVITAAFGVLDPAFASVIQNFQGTADEVATFGNTLLSVYDATKNFSSTFQANIATALGDATQATADKVLAFVQIVSQFGDVISGLGPKLQALDPASITAFVDALVVRVSRREFHDRSGEAAAGDHAAQRGFREPGRNRHSADEPAVP
jgi:hypothetical protein